MDLPPLNRTLDAAILKPEFTPDEARNAIAACLMHQPRTLCVRPCDIETALTLCANTTTEVGTVLAFPHGALPSAAKAQEARLFVHSGVQEIDMVASIGHIRALDWAAVEDDIAAVAVLCRPHGVILKVIFETCLLTPEAITGATEAAIRAGADFVKTSTGFSSEGATPEDVSLMVAIARGRIEVKASGGIRTREEALTFLRIGATRLGVGYSTCQALCTGNTANASY